MFSSTFWQRTTSRSGRQASVRATVVFLAAALVVGSGATTAAAAGGTGILNGKYSIDQVFPVQRTPAYPPCTDDTSYGSWTVAVNSASLSLSFPFSEATDGPVNIGADYLAIVESGDSGAPWGIARFSPSGEEKRLSAGTWVTEPLGGWTTEAPFTTSGQLYGVGTEGFMHASEPNDYGNFFSNLGVLLAGQEVTYSSLAQYNQCVGSRAVADFASLATYPVPGTPISRTELTSLSSSLATLSPAYEPSITNYALQLAAGTSSISFAAVTAEAGAAVAVTIGGITTALVGTDTGALALSTGTTVVTFTITASNGSTRTYTVTVTVGAAGAPAGDVARELAATGAETDTLFGLALLGALVALGGVALRARVRRS